MQLQLERTQTKNLRVVPKASCLNSFRLVIVCILVCLVVLLVSVIKSLNQCIFRKDDVGTVWYHMKSPDDKRTGYVCLCNSKKCSL